MNLGLQHSFKVFLSWESDVPGMKDFLDRILTESAAKVADNKNIQISVDEATRNLPGSPNIINSLISKIEKCDIFVADITPIEWRSKGEGDKESIKLNPNPNVMFELGYAVALKGWDRVILVRKEDGSDYKDIPSDILFNLSEIISADKDVDLSFKIEKIIDTILSAQKEQYPYFFNEERLKLNLKSEKYIPEVYLDDYLTRQKIRFFIDPYSLYRKELDELKILNFDLLNSKYRVQGIKEFNLDLSLFPENITHNSFSESLDILKVCRDQLNSTYEFLYHSGNDGWKSSYKLRDRQERFDFAAKRVLLIKEVAGQGKTNLICNIVDKFLLRRGIPFLWLNGYEIDGNDFEGSFLKNALHNHFKSLEEGIRVAEGLCQYTHKPLIIIIDGLNEIKYEGRLVSRLNAFINLLLSYEHIRVILTCRKEYFEEKFKDNYGLSSETVIIQRLNHITHNPAKRRLLLEGYCKHFNITLDVSDLEEEYLTNNMLFLRIFCDVNRGKKINRIDRRKYHLFAEYYENSIYSLSQQINVVTGENFTKSDIRSFYLNIISLMIGRDSLYNIPLEEVRGNLDSRFRGFLENILDENILIKRELDKEGEVISFTYDEFRDFMIAKYLVDIILIQKGDEQMFRKFLDNLQEANPKEGILPFLFVHIWENHKKQAKDIIKSYNWCDALFALNIWKVEDKIISHEDMEKVKRLFKKFPYRITFDLLYRWDLKTYKNLNINTLIDIVGSFDDGDLMKYIEFVFSPKKQRNNYYMRKEDDSLGAQFINQIKILINDKLYVDRKALKHLIKFSLFLTPKYPKLRLLIEQYLNDSNDREIIDGILTVTKSQEVSEILQQWR